MSALLRKLADEGFVSEVWRDAQERGSNRYVALLTHGCRGTPSWRGSGSSPEAALKEARGFWGEDHPGRAPLPEVGTDDPESDAEGQG